MMSSIIQKRGNLSIWPKARSPYGASACWPLVASITRQPSGENTSRTKDCKRSTIPLVS